MNILLKNIIKVASSIIIGVDKLLVRCYLIKPRIVMYMDGGLCSQMAMWANGQYYAQQGYRVYYDLDWYRISGKGIDGISIRNYELQTLWPRIEVKTMAKWRTSFYKHFLHWPEASCVLPDSSRIDRSIYFKGYHSLKIVDFLPIMRKNFTWKNASITNKMHLNQIKRYCGVHVRRGDLANVNIQYYNQVTDGYFIRAIEYVQKNETVDEFLLFSEDAQWLRENIVPNVSIPCRIMEGNTGYEDLMLLAQCQIIIASQGSFGPTAALINPNCELLIRNTSVSDIPYAKREIQIK